MSQLWITINDDTFNMLRDSALYALREHAQLVAEQEYETTLARVEQALNSEDEE